VIAQCIDSGIDSTLGSPIMAFNHGFYCSMLAFSAQNT